MLIIIVLCGILFTAPLWSLGNQDKPAPQETIAPFTTSDAPSPAERVQERIRVRGRVRLVGSMPRPSLVISGSGERDWYLEEADRALAAPYEQRFLTVEGLAEYRELVLANGEKIGVRSFLRDITIIEAPE